MDGEEDLPENKILDPSIKSESEILEKDLVQVFSLLHGILINIRNRTHICPKFVSRQSKFLNPRNQTADSKLMLHTQWVIRRIKTDYIGISSYGDMLKW